MNRFVFLGVLTVLLGWSSHALANPFVINELVPSPQQDWNDATTPFDPTPGSDAATESDEYIELKNVTVTPQSLQDYYLEMLDGTPAYDCFTFDAITPPDVCTQSQVYRVYDSAGTFIGDTQAELQAVPAGGYVVIGNPDGSLANAVTVSLVDSTLATVDSLTAPYGSSWAGDESASRFPDGVDTDVDEDDVSPIGGTPGSSNGALCSRAVGDVVVNEVVSDPQQDWDDDSMVGTPFDGTAGPGTVGGGDEYVELKNTSGAALDLTNCVVDFADSTRTKLVLSSTDAPGAPYVRVFDSTGTQVGTASSVNAVPIDGYVVVGDPPGAVNDNSTVSVFSDAGTVDGATIDAGADSIVNESASRFSDGTDTDVDTDDFAPLAATPGRANGDLCTIAAGDLVVNEVVTDPRQDWNDDTGVGTPFDGMIGPGTNSSDDEYVELKNTSAGLLDVSGCVLHMTDNTSERMVLQDLDAPADPYVRVFDATGAFVGNAASLTAVPAGGYVLIGDPPGSILNDATVSLQTDAGTLDTITVDANASSPVDEAASRFPDGTDTDVDADDVRLLQATPGASNGEYCPLAVGDAVINEVVTDPQSDWDHDGAATAFDGTAMSGNVTSDDELIELKNTSGAEASFAGCTVEMNDTSAESLLLQTVDAPFAPWIRVFDDTGTMVGTATSIDVVPAGGYVLIGNPAASMNNDIEVRLLADVEIDAVDFGNDAPNLNASDTEDEAGARLPDGADTDVGADDFGIQRATPGANNEIDECALGLADCDPLASCTDTAAGFDCTCPVGYIGTGQTCVDANECAAGSDDCDTNATCTNTDGSFTCACNEGFTGDGRTCTDVDECAGGEAMCDENAVCLNLPGGFDCTCNTGFEGDGLSCADRNECVSNTHDCDDNAFCTNTPGAFTCDCKPGFDGDGRTCTGGDTSDDPESDTGDGCSCEVAGGRSSGAPWSLLLGVALAFASRRRRV